MTRLLAVDLDDTLINATARRKYAQTLLQELLSPYKDQFTKQEYGESYDRLYHTKAFLFNPDLFEMDKPNVNQETSDALFELAQPFGRTVYINGRTEYTRNATASWRGLHGYGNIPLYMRPVLLDKKIKTPVYKVLTLSAVARQINATDIIYVDDDKRVAEELSQSPLQKIVRFYASIEDAIKATKRL